MASQTKGLILGVYEGEQNGEVVLTKAAEGFKNSKADQLLQLIQLSGLADKKGKSRVFYGLDAEYSSVAVVSLGKKDAGFSEIEQRDEGRENVRAAVAGAVKKLKKHGSKVVHVDPCGDAEAAAEGAHLNLFVYDEFKAEDKREAAPEMACYVQHTENPDSVQAAWKRGTILGEGQNLARFLMEAPSNRMTPTRFASIAQEKLGKLDNVKVEVRDQAWAEEQKMGAFLGVAQGSVEPLKFVEVTYSGGKEGDAPLAFVGKGVTFDTGGISLKPPAGMDEMRADMGGAACTLGALYTAARLGLPVNIKGFMPLCENMPSGTAIKPGDVLTAMNGKTIQVDNTDAEGRLLLCDALCYAQTFKPSHIIDLATLTGAMMVALGAGAAGCYTNSQLLWDAMNKAGQRSGDRVWRMPIFGLYTKQVKQSTLADLNNVTGSRMGGACTAACFLKEFVTHDHWMHLDIAGVMSNTSEVPYLGKGKTGRPTRTLVEFISSISK